jgi:hypothetical protein
MSDGTSIYVSETVKAYRSPVSRQRVCEWNDNNNWYMHLSPLQCAVYKQRQSIAVRLCRIEYFWRTPSHHDVRQEYLQYR